MHSLLAALACFSVFPTGAIVASPQKPVKLSIEVAGEAG